MLTKALTGKKLNPADSSSMAHSDLASNNAGVTSGFSGSPTSAAELSQRSLQSEASPVDTGQSPACHLEGVRRLSLIHI